MWANGMRTGSLRENHEVLEILSSILLDPRKGVGAAYLDILEVESHCGTEAASLMESFYSGQGRNVDLIAFDQHDAGVRLHT